MSVVESGTIGVAEYEKAVTKNDEVWNIILYWNKEGGGVRECGHQVRIAIYRNVCK